MGQESASIEGTGPLGPLYIYPIIASIFVLVAVIALCSVCKKKNGHKYKKQQSAGQEAVQEDVIQAQTTNQVKSTPLGHNFVPEDQVLKEDQDIFKSYMNLRFIDETDDTISARKLLML